MPYKARQEHIIEAITIETVVSPSDPFKGRNGTQESAIGSPAREDLANRPHTKIDNVLTTPESLSKTILYD